MYNYLVLEVRKGKWRKLYGPSSFDNCMKRVREIVTNRVQYEDDRVLEERNDRFVMSDCVIMIKEPKK